MDRFEPGNKNPEGSAPGDWRPCGKCEGVVYFRDLRDGDSVLVRGTERQALNYLLGPLSDVAGLPAQAVRRAQEARDFTGGDPRRLGITYPIADAAILRLIPKAERDAAAKGRELQVAFTHCMEGLRPARFKWIVRAVEEGVWALVCDGV